MGCRIQMIEADASAATAASPILARSTLERRAFAGACAIYGALALVLLPWANSPAPSVPAFSGAYAGTGFIADLGTAFMLAADYRSSGRPALLGVACAYLYASCMAFAQGLASPGAIMQQRPLGSGQWSGWIFVAWRVGFGIL